MAAQNEGVLGRIERMGMGVLRPGAVARLSRRTLRRDERRRESVRVGSTRQGAQKPPPAMCVERIDEAAAGGARRRREAMPGKLDRNRSGPGEPPPRNRNSARRRGPAAGGSGTRSGDPERFARSRRRARRAAHGRRSRLSLRRRAQTTDGVRVRGGASGDGGVRLPGGDALSTFILERGEGDGDASASSDSDAEAAFADRHRRSRRRSRRKRRSSRDAEVAAAATANAVLAVIGGLLDSDVARRAAHGRRSRLSLRRRAQTTDGVRVRGGASGDGGVRLPHARLARVVCGGTTAAVSGRRRRGLPFGCAFVVFGRVGGVSRADTPPPTTTETTRVRGWFGGYEGERGVHSDPRGGDPRRLTRSRRRRPASRSWTPGLDSLRRRAQTTAGVRVRGGASGDGGVRLPDGDGALDVHPRTRRRRRRRDRNHRLLGFLFGRVFFVARLRRRPLATTTTRRGVAASRPAVVVSGASADLPTVPGVGRVSSASAVGDVIAHVPRERWDTHRFWDEYLGAEAGSRACVPPHEADSSRRRGVRRDALRRVSRRGVRDGRATPFAPWKACFTRARAHVSRGARRGRRGRRFEVRRVRGHQRRGFLDRSRQARRHRTQRLHLTRKRPQRRRGARVLRVRVSRAVLAVDTACSSSIVSTRIATEAIARGDVDAAASCGVSAVMSVLTSGLFNAAGMLAPDGRCKTLDAAANGYVRAEARGVLILEATGVRSLDAAPSPSSARR